MKITTSKGKTFDAGYIFASVRDGSRLMIDYRDERLLSQAAEDWENVEMIIGMEESNPNIETSYKGYTQLTAISRNESDGSVRITLKRP